jgi:hypothetical protein
MKVAGLDPGPGESGFVVIGTEPFSVLFHTTELNRSLLGIVRSYDHALAPSRWDAFGVEWMEQQGIRLTDEVTETVLWTGAMIYEWGWWDRALLVRPREVKKALYGTCYGTDARKRQALIQRFGEPGTKKCPGLLFGIKGHEWSALAVAVVAAERILGRPLGLEDAICAVDR